MFHSSFFYTASYSIGFVPQQSFAPDDARAPTPPMLFGLPMTNHQQFYTSLPPNYYQFPIPFPDYTQLPVYPSTDTAAVTTTSAANITDTAASSVSSSNYSSDLGSTSGLSQTTSTDSWLEHSLTSVHSDDDVVSIEGDSFNPPEASSRFVGTFAPSYRGASPVLLYRIPSTDLCYVYNRIRTADGSKGHYVCRECYLKKKYVPAKIMNRNYFTKDPLAGGHICRPKSFAREIASRHSAKMRLCGVDNDSGLSSSFSGIY